MEYHGQLKREQALLLVIDVQEKFAPVIPDMDDVVKNAAILARGCRELKIPAIVTEQYRKGLGLTMPALVEALGSDYEPIEKMAFSLFNDKELHRKIDDMGRKDLLVLGVESHVCVLKTVLDARTHGYNVHLVVDAVSSRSPMNKDVAVRRAAQAGAFLTSAEIALFQMMDTAEDPAFRPISKIVK